MGNCGAEILDKRMLSYAECVRGALQSTSGEDPRHMFGVTDSRYGNPQLGSPPPQIPHESTTAPLCGTPSQPLHVELSPPQIPHASTLKDTIVFFTYMYDRYTKKKVIDYIAAYLN